MKLNKIEKIFVYVVILGLILIGGYFIFIHPYWAQIEKSQKTLEKNKKEYTELNTKLEPLRSGTLAASIETRRKEAVSLEGMFFPDMTTYETVESALTYLQAQGFETHTISVDPLKTYSLSLEYYVPAEIKYDLKTLAQGAKDTAEEPEQVAGTFTIGNKTYTVAVTSLTNFQVLDEDGNEVKTYNEQMQKVIKAAMCKYAKSAKLKQTVGLVQAKFHIKGKFEDYVKLIDDIYSFNHRAMMTSNVLYPRTIKPSKDKDDENTGYAQDETGYVHSTDELTGKEELIVTADTEIEEDITLMFLSVEPMNALDKVDVAGTADKADDIVVNQRPAVY